MLTNILPRTGTLLVNHLNGLDPWLQLTISLVRLTPSANLLWIRHPQMSIPAVEGVLSFRIE